MGRLTAPRAKGAAAVPASILRRVIRLMMALLYTSCPPAWRTMNVMIRIVGLLLLFSIGCGEDHQEEMTQGEWQPGHVTANGIQIHYWRTGGDKPVMVMSHGVTDNGLCWTTLARALEADYDIIMYDARGHGLSDKPETGYGIDDHAADLVGLLEALELRAPILMGHSMGGAIVAVTAAQHPDLPRAVVLEDPVHMGPPPEPSPEE